MEERTSRMAVNRPTYSTRSLSLVMLAAFAGIGLWLFAPWGGGQGTGHDGGAGAALPASLKLDGAVQVESADNVVTRLVLPLAVRGDQSIDLTAAAARLRAETEMSESASAAVPATYSLAWSDGNGDQVLDPGEHVVMTVDLPSPSSVHPGNPLQLVITPSGGGRFVIEDVLGR
jgi:hypothetical protein